ncbi:enoyl-CoA hydratase-related protein [Nonomuraea sp. NPDC050643]|uniref:enoyl-CoA hydratase/isomerase family protein n=1 Tax=Nonomuraea sp. NPDC050643 TaxID=3155660 RepID=UPI003404534E
MKNHLDVRRDGGTATIVIDRPPANAVDPALIDEFLEVLPGLAGDAAVRCLVIRGTGRFFVAGADIAVMRDLSEANHVRMRRWVEVQRLLELAPKPVVAAMNGHALGGGAELSLACDLRILAASATIGFPEMSLGLFPGAGGSQRLPRLLGPHRAKRLMIDGARLSAAEALDLGLVDVVAADEDFDRVVAEHAASLGARPTAAIGLLKRAVDAGSGLPVEEALEVEWKAVMELIATADAAEGLQAFLDERPPRFTGR